MKKVFAALPNYSQYCGDAKKYLIDNGCEVIENETGGPLDFEHLKEYVADVDAVIAGVDTWDKKILDLAPKLKIIARFGVGVDNIDLEELKKRGIICTNCPGLNSVSVAEHTIMLMLNLLRECPQLNEDAHKGNWRRLLVTEIKGKTVGLLGFGAIAKNVASRLKAFECRVIAYDKYPDLVAAEKMGVKMCSLEHIFKNSDIISAHIPSLPDTYHIIGEENIRLCKDGVYIVNTSRGTNTDEKAIYNALQSKKIAGYAADVFEYEPVTADYELFKCDKYICTPHTAAESYENYYHTGMKTAQAILDVFNGNLEPWHKLV